MAPFNVVNNKSSEEYRSDSAPQYEFSSSACSLFPRTKLWPYLVTLRTDWPIGTQGLIHIPRQTLQPNVNKISHISLGYFLLKFKDIALSLYFSTITHLGSESSKTLKLFQDNEIAYLNDFQLGILFVLNSMGNRSRQEKFPTKFM